MNIPVSSLALRPSDAFDRLMDQVLAGGDVAIMAPAGAADALLDKAMRNLAIQDSRVFRVGATPSDGLSIAKLVAEVTGRLERTQQDDQVLEEAFGSLTTLDDSCDRIVLLVSGAEALPRSTLRYIQLAMRLGSRLQVVFAGAPGFLAAFDNDEFAPLRARLTAQAAIILGSGVPLMPEPPSPAATMPKPRAAQVERRPAMLRALPRRPAAVAAGLGLALVACLALGGWLLHRGADVQQAAAQLGGPPSGIDPAPPVQQPPVRGQPHPVLPEVGGSQGATPAAVATASPVLPDTTRLLSAPPAAQGPVAAVVPPAHAPQASDPRDAKTRLEMLSEELEASRRQASRTRPTARKAPRAAAVVDAAPAAPPDLTPAPAAGPQENASERRDRFIGSYTTDADGTRTFRASQP